jgi:hypothetical protein
VSAFKNGVAAVQAQTSVRSLFAVTSEAGDLEERLNVFVVGEALLSGSGGELGNINFADVPIIHLLLSQERRGCESEPKNNGAFHF